MDAMTWTRSEQDHLLEAALEAARRAGEIVRRSFRSAYLEVERKSDHSPVTVADRESEAAIREVLHRATPGLGFLGEELGAEGSERDRWVIDPIDVTKNFVAGLPYFATLIALVIGGAARLGVVHAPALGETWWAIEGRGAWAGTGTALEGTDWRRLEVSAVGELSQAFLSHGGGTRWSPRVAATPCSTRGWPITTSRRSRCWSKRRAASFSPPAIAATAPPTSARQ
jgi:histidinol-phosphatase